MCANIHSQNGTAILAQELSSRKWENLKGIFLPIPSIRATAMSGAPVSFDRIIPEETQGPMPVEAPTTLASGSLDSFHHVEAVLKEDNVSTGTLDSQDWEMVTEMVEDTDNAATHFLQGKHVVDLEGPAPNLQDSIDKMIETVEKMKLGSTADGVEAPSRPEGVASAAAVPSGDAAPMDDSVVEQTTHKWKVFGRGTSSPTFILADVPFQHEAVTMDIKQMVDKFSTEEIYDLFVKFCDSESIPAVSFGRVIKAYVAMKAQKVHDEVMKQPHVAGRSRPGVGSDSLRENTQPDPIATHQCPECFTDWATQWDPSKERMCVCGKKVLPIKKTKHLVNMDHPSGNWLLFVTGNGITWVRDGKSEADAASASGDVSSKSDKDFKLRHAVDIGMLAEAPLCPADHAETSLSDFLQSKDRLQLRTEVLNRVVDAETFPSEAPSRPQIPKDCKKEQAALVFHPDAAAAMALAGKLTGADVPPEEAFHPKRPEAEMLKVVQDNADILHDMQSGAMSVEDPQGAEALRHLDLVKFKEVLKRKFLEGSRVQPDCLGSAEPQHGGPWHSQGQKPGVWGSQEGLQAVLDTTTWEPIHLGRESPTIDWGWILLPIDWLSETQPGVGSVQCHWGIRQGEAHDCRASTTGLSWQAFDWGPPVPTGHACGNRSPRQVIPHGGQKIGARISRSQGGPSSSHHQHVWWRDPTTCWQVEKIWVHGGPNLGQATPANLGRCAGIGTPHTPQRSRIQLCGVLHVHWWGAWGPQASGIAPLLVLFEGQLLCLWTCACRWRCRDLLGEGSPDMDLAYFAGDLWPSILPEAAVVCLGEPPHCCEKTQPRTTWWWSARSSRPHCWKEEDPEGDHGFPGTDAVAKANLGGGVAFDLARSWDTAGSQALHQPHAGSCDGFAGGRCGWFQGAAPLPSHVRWEDLLPLWGASSLWGGLCQAGALCAVQLLCGNEGGMAMQHGAMVVGRGWPCPCWASLSQVELLRWGHSGFWFGSRPASWGSCVGCSCRRRWLLDKDSFADGISWSATPPHHRWKCELCDGQGFQKEGGGKREAHLLGQNWVWTGPEFRHPLGNH